jgi:basic membrane protein A
LSSIVFREQESSYLAGVAAATATKTNHIAVIGGMKSDLINKFIAGFQAGAKSIKSDIKVDYKYAQTFTDATIAKQIAAGLYDGGADVIYQAAGGAGAGVIQEAKARKDV